MLECFYIHLPIEVLKEEYKTVINYGYYLRRLRQRKVFKGIKERNYISHFNTKFIDLGNPMSEW